MSTNANARPGATGAGAANVQLGGERAQHTTTPIGGEAPDPVLALLAKLDAETAREGLIEVDGRTLLVRPIAGGYAIERRA